jgi:hypothetical protein
MLFGIAALVALLPFALVGFLYREAQLDTRPALLWAATFASVMAVCATLLILEP